MPERPGNSRPGEAVSDTKTSESRADFLPQLHGEKPSNSRKFEALPAIFRFLPGSRSIENQRAEAGDSPQARPFGPVHQPPSAGAGGEALFRPLGANRERISVRKRIRIRVSSRKRKSVRQSFLQRKRGRKSMALRAGGAGHAKCAGAVCSPALSERKNENSFTNRKKKLHFSGHL